ncbi:hypothetical protein JD969_20310 [Planctomycetota bacterium]|nr:hypothetical protein JD969_20310 [Planctomycetota bacterium]
MKTNVLDKLTTIIAVSAITLLVWLWAEGRITKDGDVNLTVQFTGQNLKIIPEEEMVKVQFRASQSAIDALKKDLNDNGDIIKIPVSSDQNSVSIKDALDDSELFKEHVITIKNTSPPTMPLDVIPLETKMVRVAAKTNGNVRLDNTSIEPSEVSVTLPAAQADSVNDVSVYLQPEDYHNAEENVPQSAVLPVRLNNFIPEGMVKITPEVVKLNYTIQNQTEVYQMPSVPIVVSVAPDIRKGREVLLPENQKVLRDVVFEGPKDLIEMIKRHERRVEAVIRPTAAQLESGGWNATIEIMKPDQVRVVSPSPLPQIPVTVQQQSSDGSAANGGLTGVVPGS